MSLFLQFWGIKNTALHFPDTKLNKISETSKHLLIIFPRQTINHSAHHAIKGYKTHKKNLKCDTHKL